MEKETLLGQVRLFSGLKEKDLKSIAEFCVERHFKKGEALVTQGETGLGLYIIESGKVRIVKETIQGESLEVAFMESGDFFGEMTVLDNAPRSATVLAVEDTSCLVLTSWEFKARLELNPKIALAILKIVVQRFRETNEKLLALSHL